MAWPEVFKIYPNFEEKSTTNLALFCCQILSLNRTLFKSSPLKQDWIWSKNAKYNPFSWFLTPYCESLHPLKNNLLFAFLWLHMCTQLQTRVPSPWEIPTFLCYMRCIFFYCKLHFQAIKEVDFYCMHLRTKRTELLQNYSNTVLFRMPNFKIVKGKVTGI